MSVLQRGIPSQRNVRLPHQKQTWEIGKLGFIIHTKHCINGSTIIVAKSVMKTHLTTFYIFQHTCGYCGNRFPERRTLVKHERCHTGEKPYACDSCDFRCSSSSSLCQHKRRRHDPTESGRKHICEQCGKGFYTRDNLKVSC